MQCVICHSDAIETREVKEEISLGADIVMVPVQAMVCRRCGERYYDRRTMRHLEEVERRLQSGRTSLKETGRVLQVEPE